MKNDQTPQKGSAFKKLSFGKTNKKVNISGKSDNLKKDYRKNVTIDFMHLGPPLYSNHIGKCLKRITARNCRFYIMLFLYQSIH